MEPLYALFHLDLDERIIIHVRQHWWFFFKKILAFILEILVLVVIYIILVNFKTSLLEDPIITPILFLAATAYLLFAWVKLFSDWVVYYLSIWVVTNKQVISVEQKSIFNRLVARQPLHRIQDVMATSQGVIATILKFGNVRVQSAGTQDYFLFKNVPRPFEIEAKINDLIERLPKK
ncbi:MAG: PH domain-containing protein [Patescibacteria group bacterium]|nr:PH domain-containing protein [Patescibacteria group bacterium]MDD5121276.1 PH domain-containing protein [Patescibacteria group bacterium]MDD5221831.1 PH domain-containing protein [Patescibacteria group bacterium]MDD5395805.1 PH domain-containing protein [Patescibacteria group bacterium]